MRLIKVSSIKSSLNFSPKRLFRSKKDRIAAGSRSGPSSFSSSSSSSDASASASVHRKPADSGTPTSVLPGTSGDWSALEPLPSFNTIGSVPRKQLEALLSRDEVAMMLREVGDDDAAYVSVEELMARVGCGPSSAAACDAAELRETFDFFDADHDGRITAEELFRVFTALGDDDACSLEDCRRMIAEVDKNGDGFVCFEDFAHMMELQS